MKCKRFRQDIILLLYGELPERKSAELAAHLEKCSSCAQDFAYSSKVFRIIDDAGEASIPEADWARSWARIEENIRNQPGKKRSWHLVSPWVYATAGLLIVFALGLFIARFWSPFTRKTTTAESFPVESLFFTLNQHLDDIMPILVEYANYSSSKKVSGTITVDSEIVRQLLIQNILLKRLLAEKNPSAEELLEDLDLVLREICHQKKEDSQTPIMIKDLIEQREILSRIEVLKKI